MRQDKLIAKEGINLIMKILIDHQRKNVAGIVEHVLDGITRRTQLDYSLSGVKVMR